MFDDLHSDGSHASRHRARRSDGERPLADREVPIDQPAGTLPLAVHLWLDGELPEAAVRKGDTLKDVELWQRINGTLQARSHARTPAYLEAQIMAALPDRAPTLITPWWRRELVLTPATVFAGAAALIALTAVITSAIGRF